MFKNPSHENSRCRKSCAEMSPLPKHAPFGAADVWADRHFNMGTFRHGAFSARGLFGSRTFRHKAILASGTFHDIPTRAHFNTQTFRHWIFLAGGLFGMGTFRHRDFSALLISKYFDRILVKYSPIQVSSPYLCQQGQKMV